MRGGPWNRQRQLGPSGGVHKRPRSDYDLAAPGLYSGHEMHSYLARDDDFGDPRALKNTKSIGSEYDNYLQNVQMSSHTSGEASSFGGTGLGRAVGGGMVGLPMTDHSVMGHPGPIASDLITNGRNMSFANQLPVDAMARPGRETAHLPPDASNTLYVEGLPPDSTKREVARILDDFLILPNN